MFVCFSFYPAGSFPHSWLILSLSHLLMTIICPCLWDFSAHQLCPLIQIPRRRKASLFSLLPLHAASYRSHLAARCVLAVPESGGFGWGEIRGWPCPLAVGVVTWSTAFSAGALRWAPANNMHLLSFNLFRLKSFSRLLDVSKVSLALRWNCSEILWRFCCAWFFRYK